MTVWVLFVWLTLPFPNATAYETQAECKRYEVVYKRAVCVKVEVPKQ